MDLRMAEFSLYIDSVRGYEKREQIDQEGNWKIRSDSLTMLLASIDQQVNIIRSWCKTRNTTPRIEFFDQPHLEWPYNQWVVRINVESVIPG